MEFYKNKKEIEFKVGVFSLVAIIVLIAGYMWLTNMINEKNYNEILVSFEDAAHLEPGTTVFVRGINCGKVNDVTLRDDDVLVSLLLHLDVPLKTGAKFIISDLDLMGNKQIEIIQAKSGKPLDLTKIQKGITAKNVSDLMEEVSKIIFDFSQLLGDDNSSLITDLSEMISGIKTIFKNVNELVGENSEKISETINSLHALSDELQKIVESNKNGFNKSGDLIVQMKESMKNLDGTLAKIDKLADMVSTEDSSVNKLLTEKELYEDLLKTSKNLDSLIVDIKRNPKRYFKLF